MTHIEEIAASSNRIDCNFKPFACLLCYKHFIFSCFRKVAIPLFDSKSQSSKNQLQTFSSQWNLDRQSKHMSLVIVLLKFVRENDPVYSKKKKVAINMHNLAVLKVLVIHIACDSNINSGTETYAANVIFTCDSSEGPRIQRLFFH